jgi:hypothetical protein
MPSRSRVRRRLAVGVVAVSMAVGLAACSSGAGAGAGGAKPAENPFPAVSELKSFLASTSPATIVLSETLQGTGQQQSSVYTGTGSLDRPDGAWSVSALPLRVTSTFYAQKVIEAGGDAYMDPASLSVVLPGAKWITISGSIDELRNTPPLPLGITPLMAAEAASASGVRYVKAHVGEIFGVKEQGYTASMSASTAMSAIAAARTPAAYQAIARLLLDNRTLLLTVYLSSSGKLGAFGYACATEGSDDAVSVLYYITKPLPGARPAAPTSGIVSLAEFNKALTAYDRKTHQKRS